MNIQQALQYSKGWFLRNIRATISSVLVILALADIFFIEISWVTLAIIALAFLPWLLDFVKSASVPGFGELDTFSLSRAIYNIENRDAPIGLPFREADPPNELTIEQRLALGRRDLEIEMRALLQEHGLSTPPRSLSGMIKKAVDLDAISPEERSMLADIIPIMNAAIHGQEVPPTAVEKAYTLFEVMLERFSARQC